MQYRVYVITKLCNLSLSDVLKRCCTEKLEACETTNEIPIRVNPTYIMVDLAAILICKCRHK